MIRKITQTAVTNIVLQHIYYITFCMLEFSSYSGSLLHFSSVAYIWGAGDGGQLGTGTKECSLLPIKFPVSCEVR